MGSSRLTDHSRTRVLVLGWGALRGALRWVVGLQLGGVMGLGGAYFCIYEGNTRRAATVRCGGVDVAHNDHHVLR